MPASHKSVVVVGARRAKTTTTTLSEASQSWLRSSSPIAPKDYYFWDPVAEGLACAVVVGQDRTQATTTTTTTAAEIALSTGLTFRQRFF